MLEKLIGTAASAVEGAAAVLLVWGAASAFVQVAWLALRGQVTHATQREVWLRLARWLVLSLEFQLAADVLHTAVAPTWTEIGRVAALALIRTFLNHALEADLEKAARPPRAPAAEGARGAG